MGLDYIGTDVHASVADNKFNSGRIIRLFCPAGPVLRTTVLCLITFCRRPKGANDVISFSFVRSNVLDKSVKLRGPILNRSREIPPEAVGGGIFDSFFATTSDRK